MNLKPTKLFQFVEPSLMDPHLKCLKGSIGCQHKCEWYEKPICYKIGIYKREISIPSLCPQEGQKWKRRKMRTLKIGGPIGEGDSEPNKLNESLVDF